MSSRHEKNFKRCRPCASTCFLSTRFSCFGATGYFSTHHQRLHLATASKVYATMDAFLGGKRCFDPPRSNPEWCTTALHIGASTTTFDQQRSSPKLQKSRRGYPTHQQVGELLERCSGTSSGLENSQVSSSLGRCSALSSKRYSGFSIPAILRGVDVCRSQALLHRWQ